MIYFSDGAINPPHFYISGDKVRCALFHYTSMAKHPRLPPIDRSRIHDLPPPVMEPPSPPTGPASSTALAHPTTPVCAPSPVEDPLAGKIYQTILSM
jgi:hypothetical protein